MAEDTHKHWRDLCNDAIAARDTNELLAIIQELNATLEREEQTRRELRSRKTPQKLHTNFGEPQ